MIKIPGNESKEGKLPNQ